MSSMKKLHLLNYCQASFHLKSAHSLFNKLDLHRELKSRCSLKVLTKNGALDLLTLVSC